MRSTEVGAEEPEGQSTIRLTRGGWIKGVVVDLDQHNFYVELSEHSGARGLVEKAVDGVARVPRSMVASMKTAPSSSAEQRYPLKVWPWANAHQFTSEGWANQEITPSGGGPWCRCPEFEGPEAEKWPFKKQAEVVAGGDFDLQLDGIKEQGYDPPLVVRYSQKGFCRDCAPGGDEQ